MGSETRTVMTSMLVSLGTALPLYEASGASVEIERSLELGAAKVGIAFSAYFVGAAVSAIPLSRIAQRCGSAQIMRFGAVVDTAILLALALGSHSWAVLTMLLLVAGVVAGGVLPATYLFLSSEVPHCRQGRAFGINQAATPLAGVLGGLAVPTVAVTVGWPWVFVLGGLVSSLASALVPRRRRMVVQPQSISAPRADTSVRVFPLAALSVGMGLGMFAVSGLLAFLARDAVAVGFGPAGAGLLFGGVSTIAVAARVTSGLRADRQRQHYLRVVAVMMAIGAFGFALTGLGENANMGWALIVGALVALGIGWGWNGLFMFAVARSHGQAAAKATGIIDVGGRVGGIVGPVVAGFLIAHISSEWASMAEAVAAATGAAVVAVAYHLGAPIQG